MIRVIGVSLFALAFDWCDPEPGNGLTHFPAQETPYSDLVLPTNAHVCTTTQQCDGQNPPCTIDDGSFCACTRKVPGTTTCQGDAGYCAWRIDPTVNQCVCVPGTIQKCRLSPTSFGVRVCDAYGKQWGGCGAL